MKEGCFVYSESQNVRFVEIAKYGKYTVVMRLNDKKEKVSCEPYVVARNVGENGWDNGAYFSDLSTAIHYAELLDNGILVHKTGLLSYNRLVQICRDVIRGLYMDDAESAEEYLSTYCMTDKEKAMLAEACGGDFETLEEASRQLRVC